MIKGVDHIGLGVKDINSTLEAFARVLKVPIPPVKYVAEKKMWVALLELGPINLEILQDDSDDGMLATFTRERGDGIHHFCVASDDIDADVEEMKRRGIEMMHEHPVMGVRGKRIAFTRPDALNGIPMELSEP
ncbi:MAG: VOC family protein [Sphingomonadaceae bacterium]